MPRPAPSAISTPASSGLVAGLAAYLAWGLLPMYWKEVQIVPALEILCHRIIWSGLFCGLCLHAIKGWREVGEAFRSRKNMAFLAASSLLVATNWGVYIYAVNAGYVLQCSLGYYINPLVNVVLGFLFFQDRPRPLQWLAIGLAAAGVTNEVLRFGHLPWIALVLAFSFGMYGLVRKKMGSGPLVGIFIETCFLSIPALIWLILLELQGRGALGARGLKIDLLLLGAGAVTTLPLLGFTYGARRLSLVTMGILQYVAPTCMFLLGVLVYDEAFSPAQLATFVLIWCGVLLYTGESSLRLRRQRH
ncbi:MAG: EamA family transporter RarD [Desulfobacterales bacterium]